MTPGQPVAPHPSRRAHGIVMKKSLPEGTRHPVETWASSRNLGIVLTNPSRRAHGIVMNKSLPEGTRQQFLWVVLRPPAWVGSPPAAITGWYSAPRRFHGNASSGFHSLFFGWYSAPRRGLDRLQRQSLGGIPPPGVRWTASSSGHVFFGPPPAAITGWYTAPRRVFLWVVISGQASLKQRPKDVDE